MRSWLGVLRAFLARDCAFALSYRLEFALQVLTVVFHVSALYFLSGIVGSNPATDPYGGYLPFAAIGMAVMSWFLTGFDSFARAIHREQIQGTLEALLMSPLRVPTIVVAASAWRFLRTASLSLLYVLAAVLLYDVALRGSVLLVLTILVTTTLAFASFGLLSASFLMVYKRGDPVGMVVGGVSALLGGVFYPVEALPDGLWHVAQALPITHGLHAIREVLLQGAGVRDVAGQLAVLVAFAAVGVPLGLLCFQRAVRRARREGTLLHY
jgi:ABC-2 type transport system permease protein